MGKGGGDRGAGDESEGQRVELHGDRNEGLRTCRFCVQSGSLYGNIKGVEIKRMTRSSATGDEIVLCYECCR